MTKQDAKPKLMLNKATVLRFFETNQIMGGIASDCDPFTTCADNCSSKPGRPDSCTSCLTNEPSCSCPA
jgi:hypothetical protein